MESVTEVTIEGDGMISFFLVRLKDSSYRERCILRAGPTVSYKMFEREYMDSDFSLSCIGEGRLKLDKSAKTLIIYSSAGQVHKIAYKILKQKFADFNSIIWRDG